VRIGWIIYLVSFVLGSRRRAFCPRLMHDIFETPDFQGFSFADSCRFWPIVAKMLLLIWDCNGFSDDLQVVSPGFLYVMIQYDTV